MTIPTPTTGPLARSVQEAAYEVGISRSMLYREISAGRLRSRKVGRRTIVLDADLTEWLEALPS